MDEPSVVVQEPSAVALPLSRWAVAGNSSDDPSALEGDDYAPPAKSSSAVAAPRPSAATPLLGATAPSASEYYHSESSSSSSDRPSAPYSSGAAAPASSDRPSAPYTSGAAPASSDRPSAPYSGPYYNDGGAAHAAAEAARAARAAEAAARNAASGAPKSGGGFSAPPPPRSDGTPQLERASPSGTCFLRLVFNCTLWGLMFAVWVYAAEERSGGGFSELHAVGIACAVVYAIYVALCLCSGSGRALCNTDSADAVDAYCAALRRAPVRVEATIQCYHYEQRSRQVSRTDRDGRTTWHTETYTVTIYTHSAKDVWRYDVAADVSGPRPHLAAAPMVHLRIEEVIDFVDEQSRIAFDAWLADFFARNDRDTHSSKGYSMKVRGLDRRHIMSVVDDKPEGGGGSRCYLANPAIHALVVLLGAGALYDLCILRTIPRVRWRLVKRLGVLRGG